MKYKSKYRKAILEILRSTTSHPTAEWIYEQIKKEKPKISIATVYRNLKSLKEAGEIILISSSDGTIHFDGNVVTHYHFYCDGCGKVFDIPVDLTIISKLVAKSGIKVKHYNLEMAGLCSDCQKARVL